MQISGPPAAGRRQLLHELQVRLPARAAYLEVPSEDFDSGALALVQLGRMSQNGADTICERPKESFTQKLQAVLQSLPGDLVVLLYSPWLQRASVFAATSRSHWRLRQLIETVLKSHSVVAVADDLPGSLKINLQKWRADVAWAQNEFDHPELATQAARLLEKARSNSRLEIRLAVALLTLDQNFQEVETILDRYDCLGPLLSRLWSAAPEWLKRAWIFLSQSRKPVLSVHDTFEETPSFSFLAEVIGAPGELDLALLKECLGFEREGLFVLHERTVAFAQDRETASTAMQRRMAGAHRGWKQAYTRSQQPWLALESQIHCDYHCLRAGELPDDFIFQDQWALAGRCLSLHFKKFQEAAQCYARAIERDPTDAYSHHYLAYNRSRVSPPPSTSEVEVPFERAIALEPSNLYWYPRYISWLVTRGQFVKARKVWDQALAETAYQSQQPHYYDALHREVFRAAIFADDELCRRIVDDLGPDICQIDRFRRMRLLTHLYRLSLEARDVVPISIVARVEKEKLLGPHLTPDRYLGRDRESWYSAKVDEVVGERCHLVCGRYDTKGSEEFFTAELSRADIQRSHPEVDFDDIGPGSFLEVSTYADLQCIRMHSNSSTSLRDLLEIPDRF